MRARFGRAGAASYSPMAASNNTNEAGTRLVDRVHDQLIELIVGQDLDEGDRLPSESELSRMTAVSRPVVREALTRLQASGLIESRRGSGSFVRQRPTERQIQHLRPAQVQARLDTFEVRIAVEPVAARLAAERRTDEELGALAQALEGLAAAHAAGNPGGDHDFRFHLAVATASHNPMFQCTLQALDEEVGGFIVPSLALMTEESRERARRVELEHEAIAEAIAHGDGECAEATMRLHLLQARSRALRMRW